MKLIKAKFDGKFIFPIEPVTEKVSDVLVIFPEEDEKVSSFDTIKMLRGIARGEGLTEKLIEDRKKDTTSDNGRK